MLNLYFSFGADEYKYSKFSWTTFSDTDFPYLLRYAKCLQVWTTLKMEFHGDSYICNPNGPSIQCDRGEVLISLEMVHFAECTVNSYQAV